MAVSVSEPSYIRANKLPMILPQIKPKNTAFYEEITLSPDFVRLPASSHHHSSPTHDTTPASPSRIKILTSKPRRELYEQYA